MKIPLHVYRCVRIGACFTGRIVLWAVQEARHFPLLAAGHHFIPPRPWPTLRLPLKQNAHYGVQYAQYVKILLGVVVLYVDCTLVHVMWFGVRT